VVQAESQNLGSELEIN